MIKNFTELATDELRKHALLIIEEGLRAANPEVAVINSLSLRDGKVCVGSYCTEVTGRIHVIGFGKASYRMLLGITKVLSNRIYGGVVITNNPEWVGELGNVKVILGDHPIPGENTLRATTEVLNYVRGNVSSNDLVVVLISGGGSALFEKPYPPVTMGDLSILNDLLLKSGADINEINTVRKHVSMVKGGRLAKILHPAKVFSLIISDVVGDPIDVIASGPTAPDPTTFSDAKNVLMRKGLWDRVPKSVKEVIESGLRGEVEETPKPGDAVFNNVRNEIVASNIISLRAMARKAEELGYNTVLLTSMMEGEAREIGRFLASIVRHIKKYGWVKRVPIAVLLGGETTVTVRGDGIGGRNQELALAFAIYVAGLDGVALASIGTDGKDGVSDAAGGLVTGETVIKAKELGLNPMDYLDRNDSYSFLSKVNGVIITGLTGTNVNDIAVILVR